MLGLWLAPSRRGGRLRLVGMELRGMMWIGLVNSGYSRKDGENQCRAHQEAEGPSLGGDGTLNSPYRAWGVGCSADGY